MLTEDKMKEEDPWNVESLYDLQYFNCPSCAYKHNSKQEFVNHAYNIHPESSKSLSNIKDGSISDVTIPFIVKKEKLYEENGNACNDDHIDSQNNSSNESQTNDDKENQLEAEIVSIKKEDSNSNNNISSKSGASSLSEVKEEDESVIPMVQCYYCSIQTFKLVIKTHIGECHPGQPVIYYPIGPMEQEFEEEEDEEIDNGNDIKDDDSENITVEPVINFNLQNEDSNNIMNHQCKSCNRIFNTVGVLRAHKKKCGKNDIKCDYCEEKFSFQQQLRKHITNTHKEIKQYKCELCDKAFREPGKLKSHKVMVHEGAEKIHKCDFCDKSYALKSYLKSHIKSSHGNQPPVNCHICGKSFSKQYLRSHIKEVHEGEINWKVCHICAFKCRTNSTLKTHMMTVHSDERNFPCDQCSYAAKTKAFLRKHIASKHVEVVEKKWVCSICGKCFHAQCNMNTHIKNVHHKSERSKRPCDVCKFYNIYYQIILVF